MRILLLVTALVSGIGNRESGIGDVGAGLVPARQNRDPMLVTAEWLAQHQRDPNLVLLHVGPRPSYDSAHIAGAHYADFAAFQAPRDTTKPVLELPPPALLDSALEALGISDDSRIVIYSSNGWHSPSTRVYLTLYWAGLGARTSILDGGISAFQRRGGQVTSAATPAARRGTLTLRPRSDVVVEANWVAARLTDPQVSLIDARNTRFFLGNYPARPQEPRPGRIPGAYNVEFTSVVDSAGVFLTVPQILELLASARATAGKTIVSYCHIGQQGTMIWFAAKLAGFEARLYDGSFTQWSTLQRYRVEHH